MTLSAIHKSTLWSGLPLSKVASESSELGKSVGSDRHDHPRKQKSERSQLGRTQVNAEKLAIKVGRRQRKYSHCPQTALGTDLVTGTSFQSVNVSSG